MIAYYCTACGSQFHILQSAKTYYRGAFQVMDAYDLAENNDTRPDEDDMEHHEEGDRYLYYPELIRYETETNKPVGICPSCVESLLEQADQDYNCSHDIFWKYLIQLKALCFEHNGNRLYPYYIVSDKMYRRAHLEDLIEHE